MMIRRSVSSTDIMSDVNSISGHNGARIVGEMGTETIIRNPFNWSAFLVMTN